MSEQSSKIFISLAKTIVITKIVYDRGSEKLGKICVKCPLPVLLIIMSTALRCQS